MPKPITNTGPEGYISSYVTEKTSCGDSDNPWLLTVDDGQRINITLIDFVSSETKDSEDTDNKCVVCATIRDGKSTVRNIICGEGNKHIAPVLISSSNNVEIQLFVGKVNQQQKAERQFLLKYSTKFRTVT